MLRLSIVATALLVSIPTSAGENAFNANLENPSVSTLITEFEKVCFPFISHETELTAEQDREVFQSRMIEAGYEFVETDVPESFGPWISLDPSFPRYPNLCKGLEYVPPFDDGKFTVFPEVKYKSEAYKTCTGEIGGPAYSPKFIRAKIIRQIYDKKSERPITTSLLWQDFPDFKEGIVKRVVSLGYHKGFKIRTVYPPASSCGVNIHDETLTADIIESAIIAHDPDWEKQDVKDAQTKEVLPDAYNWQQCTSQDEEHYVYSASLIRGTLSMKVKTLQDDEEAPVYNCKALDEDRG